VSDVEASLKLSLEEQRGKVVYEKVCASCHGGANKATIVNRAVHDLAFPALKHDGTIVYEVPVTDPPTRVLASQPENEFINIGSAMENFLAQIGATEQAEHKILTRDVAFQFTDFGSTKTQLEQKLLRICRLLCGLGICSASTVMATPLKGQTSFPYNCIVLIQVDPSLPEAPTTSRPSTSRHCEE
jgi:hypothetical protein